MASKKWGGRESINARAYWKPLLPRPCCRCGRPVVPRPWLHADGWHPDHWPVSREDGGTQTWPAHAECNLSAGGRRGAEITNSARKRRQGMSGV
jgi:hypothetical protein